MRKPHIIIIIKYSYMLQDCSNLKNILITFFPTIMFSFSCPFKYVYHVLKKNNVFVFFRTGKGQEPKVIIWEVLQWSSIISVSNLRNSRRKEPTKEVSIAAYPLGLMLMRSNSILSNFNENDLYESHNRHSTYFVE